MAGAARAMEQSQLALESRTLELAYEKTCRQVGVVCDAERFRQLRVRTLTLEEDKDDLHTRLAQDNDRIEGLERFNRRLQEDLEVCAGTLESAQGQLRIKSREVDTLKVLTSSRIVKCHRQADVLSQAELHSLHGVTMDSTKLLAEKLTLARELSALKPELDHLRSQAASHQSLLAEKLSLQRQLSTVQVELATEKRATQRALAKEGQLQAEDAKLGSRLESLQADLLRERRERQKVEREAQKDSVESGNRILILESRLEAFRNKLKSTKEHLKEAQTCLQTAQSSNEGRSNHTSASGNPNKSLMGNPRKRGGAQMDADTILGTPGNLPAAKKSKRGSALIGEKSTFSITPFLNRTASVAPESPPPDNASGDDEIYDKASDHLSGITSQKAESLKAISDPVNMSQTLINVVKASKVGMLQNSKTDIINSRAPPARKTKAAPILDQVAEENIENEESATIKSGPAAIRISSDATFHGGLEMKRRKRKLLGGGLGKTLFDEDEGDALKDDQGMLVSVRGIGALENGRLRVSEIGSRKPVGSNVSTFGAISPLKKDRRLLSSG